MTQAMMRANEADGQSLSVKAARPHQRPTTPPPSTTTLSPENRVQTQGALETILLLATNLFTFHYGEEQACLAAEMLNSTFYLAKAYYNQYRQPVYVCFLLFVFFCKINHRFVFVCYQVASFVNTDFHQGSGEARTHRSGLALDVLCGLDSLSRRFCGDLVASAQSRYYGNFRFCDQGSVTSCLSDSIISMLFGIVHCRKN